MTEDKMISKYTLESALLYHYRIIRALIVSLVISIFLLFATVAFCFWYSSLPSEEGVETITQTQDGESNTMIGVENNGIETDNNKNVQETY